MRYIRYYQDNEWRYANVKTVGDLSKLKLNKKTDVVTAINSLIEDGIITGDLSDRLDQVEGSVEDNSTTIKDQQDLLDLLDGLTKELENQIVEADKMIADQIIESEKIKEELKDKVGSDKYLEIKNELLEKVDSSKYEEEYNTATGNLETSKKELEDKIKETASDLSSKVEGVSGELLVVKQEVDKNTGEISSTVEKLTNVEGLQQSQGTQITQNAESITQVAGRVTGTEGRLTSAESSIIQNAESITQTVSKTDYDQSVGKNKWTVSKFNMIEGSQATSPSFGLTQGKAPSEVKEVSDAIRMNPFGSSSKYIAHYFTNVKLKSSKTVNLNVTHDDAMVIYMNSAKVYEKFGGASTTPRLVALSLREGWNTIEILHGKNASGGYIDLGTKISDAVDMMTYKIGVGDKYDTKMSEAETKILQTAESIALKADKTVVDSLGNRVSSAESSLTVMAGQIASKVESTEFDKYTQRLTTAESSIIQNANSISQKVSQTEHDKLNGKVTANTSSITSLSNEIKLKVDVSELDSVKGTIANNTTQIGLNKDAINLKASKTDLDTTNGRLTTAEASIKVNADKITQTVSKTELNAVTDRLSTAETKIQQTADSISLKADKNSVYTKQETDGKVTEAVNSAKAEIKVTTDGIKQSVSATNTEVAKKADGSTVTALSNKVSGIEQSVGQISSKVTSIESTQASEGNKVKDLQTRVSTAESKITDSAITNTVSKSFYTKGEIENKGYQNASQVEQKVDSFALKFKETGGYNLLMNTKAKNGTKYWASNGGGIASVADSEYGSCFQSAFAGGIVGEWVKLKNDTAYVYQSIINATVAHGGSSMNPMHYWCNTTQTNGGTQHTVINYRQNTVANKWTKCYVHFKTKPTGDVWFRPFVYGGGTGAFKVTEIALYEGSLEIPWSPHPSEVYDGVTMIDKDGIQVAQSNVGTTTIMDASGFFISKASKGDIFKVDGNGLTMKGNITGGNITGATIKSVGDLTGLTENYVEMKNGNMLFYKEWRDGPDRLTWEEMKLGNNRIMITDRYGEGVSYWKHGLSYDAGINGGAGWGNGEVSLNSSSVQLQHSDSVRMNVANCMSEFTALGLETNQGVSAERFELKHGNSTATIVYDGVYIKTASPIWSTDFNKTNYIYGKLELRGVKGSEYHQSAIEIREKNGYEGVSGTWNEAPSIGFHWGGFNAGTLAMHSDGQFYLRAQGYDNASGANAYRSITLRDVHARGWVTGGIVATGQADVDGGIWNGNGFGGVGVYYFANGGWRRLNG